MQATTKKKRSQRWWAILLCIPMLISCAAPIAPFIWEVALIIGANLTYTGAGQFLEQAVDEVIYKIFHNDSPGYIVPDPYNRHNGTYSTRMKLTTKDASGNFRFYILDRPRMVRESESSAWELAPDLKSLTEQVLKGGALSPEGQF